MFDPDTAIHPFPPKSISLSIDEKAYYREKIKHLLKERNVVMTVHYCTDPEIRQLAKETGGYISGSLEMACFGTKHPASTLLITEARFMGEAVRILSPRRTVPMSTPQTERLLDLGCPVEEFNTFYDTHPNHTVVVYANTSAAVKARADQVVTSNITVELIGYLDSLDEKTIQTFDRHLGRYVQEQTDEGTLCWQGACVVHDEFRTQTLTCLREEHPDAAILVHSESPQAIVDMTDAVGSASQLVAAAKTSPHQRLIVAINQGIFYKIQQTVSGKGLLETPTTGKGVTYHSCAHYPQTTMSSLQVIAEVPEQEGSNHEVHADEELRGRALMPLDCIPNFAATLYG